MPCQIFADQTGGSATIVCGPPRGVHRRRILHCPTDNRRTRFVERLEGVWFGSTFYCVACGDKWEGGELGYRPFRRGWREEAQRRARALWDTAMTPTEYDAAVRAAIDAELHDANGGE